MKIRMAIILLAVVLFLSGYFILGQGLFSTRSPESQVRETVNLLVSYGDKNMDWAKGYWVKTTRVPYGSGTTQFYFKTSWIAYSNPRNCYREYQTVKIAEDGDAIAFIVHMDDGRQEDLVKLRNGDVLNFPQVPDNYICSFWQTFSAAQDIDVIKEGVAYIQDIDIDDVEMDGKIVSQIQIKFQGDNLRLLGVPKEMDGKIVRLFYDKETGLKLGEEVIFTDQGQEGDPFGYTVTTERFLELPVEDKGLIDQADAELQFYQDMVTGS